ncbi:MAG: hypothetical protein JRK53_07135 [Deltaproteobacteria bacterium]|nr:hypothetical protein [Deltaproteobacteria bacterium]MBW1815917.1 hypothetical protein [Deltaproteobacteria bacterium]MBW2285828.1 hypothetical protein [Deltaproteobacteria bacterium]
MSYETIEYETPEAGIGILSLNRPRLFNMNLDAAGLEQALNLEDRNQALLVARGRLGEGDPTSKYF